MEGSRQTDVRDERSTQSLSWSGRIYSSLSWWRQLCWPSGTPTALQHKPTVSQRHAVTSVMRLFSPCFKRHVLTLRQILESERCNCIRHLSEYLHATLYKCDCANANRFAVLSKTKTPKLKYNYAANDYLFVSQDADKPSKFESMNGQSMSLVSLRLQ